MTEFTFGGGDRTLNYTIPYFPANPGLYTSPQVFLTFSKIYFSPSSSLYAISYNVLTANETHIELEIRIPDLVQIEELAGSLIIVASSAQSNILFIGSLINRCNWV